MKQNLQNRVFIPARELLFPRVLRLQSVPSLVFEEKIRQHLKRKHFFRCEEVDKNVTYTACSISVILSKSCFSLRERMSREMLVSFWLLLTFLSGSLVARRSFNFPYDPDFGVDVPHLVNSRGFKLEVHYVTTPDGYILALHRLVNPLVRKVGRPVMLQHGLVCTSREFLINSPKASPYESPKIVGNNLGFELSKRGYDVWLPNSRGNTYSTNHSTLDPVTDAQFWDFSFDEMIKYDEPTAIDYVLNTTGYSNLAFIGHSQGSMIMFGLLATNAKYNDLVKPFIALAPVAYVAQAHTPLKYISYIPLAVHLITRYGPGPFLRSNRFMKTIADKICSSRVKSLCSNAVFMANGFNEEQMNMTRLGVYASGFPGGTSSRNILHFGQGVSTGKFQKFNFGPEKNCRVYGSRDPPEYDIDKITSHDIVLFTSKNDWLSSTPDIELLRKKLKSKVVADLVVPTPSWNHLDFIMGIKSGEYVNKPILRVLGKYARL